MADQDSHDPDSYRIMAEELRSFVERIERLEAEKAELAEGVKEVKAEAKSRGFDAKALAAVLRRRKQERGALLALDEVVDLYENALGIFS